MGYAGCGPISSRLVAHPRLWDTCHWRDVAEIARLGVWPWFDRVVSKANPVDGLSRGRLAGPWRLRSISLPAALLSSLRRELGKRWASFPGSIRMICIVRMRSDWGARGARMAGPDCIGPTSAALPQGADCIGPRHPDCIGVVLWGRDAAECLGGIGSALAHSQRCRASAPSHQTALHYYEY